MIYITQYIGDAVDSSTELPFATVAAAKASLFPIITPFQTRNRFQLFELGEGVRVALSTMRFK